ncbi:MAG: glycosyltransferase family 2 protein [Culicoidibacterales bacterium]
MTVNISLIIPLYNSKVIKRTLDSVINQTTPFYQVLIIDDGSEDQYGKLAMEYSQKYSYIEYLRQENLGVSATRNKGIELALGEYLCFLDADDMLVPNMHQVLLEKIEQTAHFFELYHYNFWQIYANGTTEENQYFLAQKQSYQSELLLQQQLEKFQEESKHMVWTYCYRTSFLREKGIKFPEELTVFEDIYFLHQLLLENAQISIISKPLVQYCYENDSSTNSKGNKMSSQLTIFYKMMNLRGMKSWQRRYILKFSVKIMPYAEFEIFSKEMIKQPFIFYYGRKVIFLKSKVIRKVRKVIVKYQ